MTTPHSLLSKMLKLCLAPIFGVLFLGLLLTLFSGFDISPVAAAPTQTPVTADILVDTTWTPAGSPYTISAKINVQAKLTIEPGVEVRFLTVGSGLDFTSGGELEAIGTATDPIIFTSDAVTPAPGDWDGINFNNAAGTANLQYVVIEYAQIALQFNRDSTPPYSVTSSTIRYISDSAIKGTPDGSDFNYNTIYSATYGIDFNEAGLNNLIGNNIYDITNDCIAFGEGTVTSGGGRNSIKDNQIHNCGDTGIWLNGGDLTDARNIIENNQIWNTNQAGIRAFEQYGLIIQNNTLSNTALIATSPVSGTGAIVLDTVGQNSSVLTTLKDNYLYANGNGSSANYQGAIFVRDGTNGGLEITGNRLTDDNGSGLVFGGNNTFSAQTINSNAICVAGPYEIENADDNAFSVVAKGNWLGTNTPTNGTELTGTVDITPFIALSAGANPIYLPADGVSAATITAVMNDGAGHTVPGLPADGRDLSLSTSLGTLSASSFTLDGNGQAGGVSLTSNTPGAANITVTEWCGYAVTATVEFTSTDLMLTKSAVGTQVVPGNTITYTLAYTNGVVTATNVVITDTLPTGTVWVTDTAESSGFTRLQTSPIVAWNLGDLPANANGTITVVAQLPAATTGQCGQTLLNTATITSSTSEADPLNNNAGDSSITVACADVAISKNGPGGIVIPGQTITYSILYTNQGTIPAQNVVITDVNPVDGSIDTLLTGVTLPPGNGGSLDYSVTTNFNICTQNYLTNTAYINTSSPELLTGNNVATSTNSPAVQCANLITRKTPKTIAPSPGKVTTFTIEFENTGSFTVSNAVITDYLDTNVAYITDTLGVTPIINGQVVRWNVGDVGPGSHSFDIGVRPLSCIGSSIAFTNAVRIRANLLEDESDNYAQTGPVTIPCNQADLVVVKNDGVGTGNTITETVAGSYITYTISVNNLGGLAVTNVILTEKLPAHTTFVGPMGSDGWFDAGGGLYTYNVGALPGTNAGIVAGKVITFVVQVDPALDCNITEVINTVTATSNNPDADAADNTSNEQTPVRCNPLQLSKTTPAVCAIPGQLVDYSITVANNSSTAAANLLLTEYLPANTSFQGPAGVWTMVGATTYTRTVPSVADNGGTESTLFSVLVDPAIPPSVTAITNVVTLSPAGLNATLVTPIEHNAPDLYVVKNDNIELLGTTAAQISYVEQKVGQTPWLQAVKAAGVEAQATSARPGDVLSYTIGYGNAGSAAANNVVITETLPANTSFVGPLYWTHLGGGTYVYTITSLAAGSGGNLDFRVRIDNPFPVNTIGVTNTIQIGSDALLECDLSDNLNKEFTRVQEAQPGGPFYQYLPIILKSDPDLGPDPPTPTPPTATPTPLGHVSDVAADPTTNQVFIASPREDAVHVIDGSGDVYDDSVPVGHGPTGLAVLTSSTPSKVFVAHAFALNNWTPGIWIIDSDTQAVRPMSHEAGYVGAAPVKAGANSNSGWERVYVSNYFDRLPAIYGPSETRVGWVQKKNFQASYGVGVSRRTNLVYLASIDTGEVVIFDGSEAEADPNYGACHHAPPEPRNLRMIKANQATGHIFITSPPDSNTGQTNSKVFVLDENVLLQETGGPPSDSTCRWNFLQGNVSTQAIPGPAWVSNITLPGAVFAGQEGLAVNPVTNRVYVTDSPSDTLFVIDYDPATNSATSITRVTVGDNPQGVDVNPLTNKIYVGNARSLGDPYGTVSVVDGATNTVIKTIPLKKP